jgi:FkbM family methyltransferase
MHSTKLAPFTVFYDNAPEYHHLKGEIFTQGIYYFETSNPTPVIIDAGAHIGLSTLYFKKMYPGAVITAIEPFPRNFELLEKNIFENQLTNVSAWNGALADQVGQRQFYADDTKLEWFSTAGFTPGAWNGQQQSAVLSVKTEPLTNFLTQPVDFLKMDIEGAEQEVLMAAEDQLDFVRHLIVEYHPVAWQSLDKLVEFLENQQFKVQVWQHGKAIGNMKRLHGLAYIEATRSHS